MLNLSLVTLNVNGIRNTTKRRRIFQFCRLLRVDVILLQETHISCESDVHLWSFEWGGGLFASFGSEKSCGTVILVSPKLVDCVGKVEKDHEGRVVCIHLKFPCGELVVCNVYAPNRPTCRKDFFTVLSSFVPGRANCILGGDFNCVPHSALDRRSRKSSSCCTVGMVELDLFVNHRDLVDMWRFQNPQLVACTWHKPDGSVSSRLDRFYAPRKFPRSRCLIVPCPLSDHDAVVLHLSLPGSFRVEKGLWRLNTQIIIEQKFKEQFVEKYRGWQTLKPAFPNVVIWWDEVKSLVKQFAIRYCVERAHQRRQKFQSLCDRARDGSSSSDLHALQMFLDDKLHGARVRAKVQFVEADEKPTIRFYQDDTQSVVDRRIKRVRHPGGVIVESPLAVIGVFKSFYSDLYSSAAVSEDLQDSLLSNIHKTPPQSKNDNLGSDISVGELWKAVAAMKKGKSPGPDGLPVEFYKGFWEVLGGDMRDVFAAAFSLNSLSQTQRVGNIVLLPKSGDPLDPRNRRPITLLNVDYKILAKALGNRLADVMPDIVGPLQACAVRGKCIQHNLWLMRDLVEFVKDRDIPCALVSLDQEKAFDMVNHDFLFRTLESFGLNAVFIRWISLLYMDVTSIVTVNGLTSGPFSVRRGVRQGCPLSPLLYVLFSETLSTSLDRCSGFRPFIVPGGDGVKCVQYADDITCIVSDLASFKSLSEVLATFQEATGARLNKSKTKGLRLGRWRGQSLPFDASWSDVMMRVNGIWFGYGTPDTTTWAEKADLVEARLDTYSRRWLSLPGKVTVVNRFVVPLLWYPGTVIAASDHALVRLERIIFDFIWGKRKPNLVKRTVLYKTPLSGGLGLVHLPSKLRFLLLKGVFTAYENPSFPFASFVRFWGGFLFRSHWPGTFSNTRPKASYPSGVYIQISDSLRRIIDEGGPQVLWDVAPSVLYPHLFRSMLAPVCPLSAVQVAVSPEVWRSVCCKLFDSRLRDLAWRIAHGALVTNHFRLFRWGQGDGICPRVGCRAIETIQHLFLECSFVGLAWEWFHTYIIGVTGCTQWTISSDFVLYGLLPPVCPVWVRDLLLFFTGIIRRHIWNSRCRLVFDGEVAKAEAVVPLVRGDIRLRMEADHARLPAAAFRRRWREPVVYYRDGVPRMKLAP